LKFERNYDTVAYLLILFTHLFVIMWLKLVAFVDNIEVARWCRSEQWPMGWGHRMYEG
jgi:hypothetical protein